MCKRKGSHSIACFDRDLIKSGLNMDGNKYKEQIRCIFEPRYEKTIILVSDLV